MRASIRNLLAYRKAFKFRKAWNAFLLFTSFHLSRLLRRSFHWGNPMSVSIEPTTACNLRCPECPSGLRSFSRETGNLKQDFFRKTVDQLYKDLVQLTFYFQGEPYINPNFLDMVHYAHQKGIYTSTSTNGHFLSKENCEETVRSGLDLLIISIDGTTQEVYEQYRKTGRLSTVLEGCRQITRAKERLGSQTPHIRFQFLVVKPNEHQIDDIHALGKELKADSVVLKTAQLYDYQNGHPLMPTKEAYARYRRRKDGSYELKWDIKDQCWRMWQGAVITWDGKVVPCCFDKDAKHNLGNLKKNSFRVLWKGSAYQEFRDKILHNRKSIDICQNCTEGVKVWAE